MIFRKIFKLSKILQTQQNRARKLSQMQRLEIGCNKLITIFNALAKKKEKNRTFFRIFKRKIKRLESLFRALQLNYANQYGSGADNEKKNYPVNRKLVKISTARQQRYRFHSLSLSCEISLIVSCESVHAQQNTFYVIFNKLFS